MEDPRQLMRYLTIEDILIIAEAQVGNYQFLDKEQLDYLVDAVSAKFGDDSIIKLGYAITDGSINDIAVITDHIQSWVCEK